MTTHQAQDGKTPVTPDLLAGRRVLFADGAGRRIRRRAAQPHLAADDRGRAGRIRCGRDGRTGGFAARGALPDLVVSLGSAGSRQLEQVRVYQVATLEYRDMDASALGFPKGETPLLGLPARMDLPHRIPDLASASLATGASIVSGAG